MKKKILHIIQGGKGGTLEYIKLLIPRLNKNLYENIIICHGEIYNELSKIGLRTYYIEMQRKISIKNDILSLMKINQYIKKIKPDIIYSHSSKAGILGRLAAKINGIPSIYNPHGWSFSIKTSKFNKFLYVIFERIASKWGQRIVLISQSELNNALKNKISYPEKFIVINNGIDVEKYNNKNSYFNKKVNEFYTIGMCCRLTEQKDPIKFIEIANKIVKKRNNCKFILVGDGELKDLICKKITDYKLENYITLTGWTDEPQNYIKNFDIAVLTSKWEGFGLVLVEYMAAAKPVVASNIDGIPYVVRDNKDGFLCNQNNIDEFCGKILELLDNKALYLKMSNSSLERSKEFTIENVVKKHEKLFEEI